MPSFEKTRVIPCPAEQLFNVVMDIESYPAFLPWVADARVLEHLEHELKAELVADLAGFRHSFCTVDRFVRHKLVEIRLLEGPFRFLESVWTFEELGEASCRVHFSIEFEFKNMMLGMVATPVFGNACRTMVEAFEDRALALYGKGGVDA